jgi:hypothetical protein
MNKTYLYDFINFIYIYFLFKKFFLLLLVTHTHIYKRNQMAAVLPRVWRIGQILRIFFNSALSTFPSPPSFPPLPPRGCQGNLRMHFPDAFSRQRNGKSAGQCQPNGGQGVAEDGDWSEWWRTAYSLGVVAYSRSIILAPNTHHYKGESHKIGITK